MSTHIVSVETNPTAETPTLLTVDNVAALLQVSADWVRDPATRKQPRLPMIRVGKLLGFRPHVRLLFQWISGPRRTQYVKIKRRFSISRTVYAPQTR